jgi:hypothetical protein
MVAVKKTFLFLLFTFFSAQLFPQTKYALSGNYEGMSFYTFAVAIEKVLPVKFFFRDEWVKNIKIPSQSGCLNLQCILDRAFAGSTLHYLIEESGNIIVTNNYAIKVFEQAADTDEKYLAPGAGTESDNKTTGIEVRDIGNYAERQLRGMVALTGYITDEDTREPVAGVTVFCKKFATGTISNEFGYYTLNLPRGHHLIQFSYIGMKPKSIEINLNGQGSLNTEMQSDVIPLKAVVITSDKNITLQRFEVGVERINMKTFKLMPATMGEPDVLKSLLLIPGVKSVGEGSAGFNVRGGSADQNLILLYGAPLYSSSHFFGFFSAVNSDIIKDVTLYKGGIPARYGGRISSVLDIVSRDGNRKEFAGNAGISPIAAHLTLEGPVIKDTLCYLLAVRSTYSNWVLGFVNDKDLHNSRASYYDMNGKITYDPDKNNRIEISGYFSHDDFRFRFDSVYRYNSGIFAVKWRHFFSQAFFSSLSLNSSMYNYTLSSRANLTDAFRLSHNLNSKNMKADFNWFTGKHEVNFGLDLVHYKSNPGTVGPNSDSSSVSYSKLESEQALEGALYFDDKIALSKFVSVEAGLRYSGFASFGQGSVMVYNPEFPKNKQSVIDTLYYGRNEIISKYGGPEFRLSLNFRLSDNSSVKINYNRTRQYLHLLSNSVAISPTDIWKLSDYYLSPQTGNQIAAGFYELFRKRHMEFSVECYYKSIRNMIDFKGGANMIMNENIEKDIVPVRGKGYGVEIALKRTEGKLNYSLAYTFARILQQSTAGFAVEQINSGKWFPANFDKPNDLSVVCSYIFSRRISFSGNYTLSSGRPITFPVASYILYENRLIYYSDRNRYRIPDYSRLDLSITLNGNLKLNKIAHPKWTFSVYNVLARKNVYSIYFKKEGDVIKGYKLSIFGRAIPSVTYSFDF